jgi:hypothetical protein
MRYLKSNSGAFFLIFCCVLVTIAPLIEQDYPLTHSTHFNLSWAFQYQQQFLAGQFYPRWLEYSNFGFGNATFVFYPPWSMVATLPFTALGWSVSASLWGSMILALWVFALGIYHYASCFFRRTITLLITLCSLFNPYLLIDIYQRGAIGEVWAIAWIPWILWATHQLMILPPDPKITIHRTWAIIRLSVTYGLLILSHLPTLLLFSLTGWVIPWIVRQRTIAPQKEWGFNRWGFNILYCYGGGVLALGLTSFYLLPVILDQRLIQVQQLHPDGDYFPQNRLLFTGLTRLVPQATTHWFDQTLLPYTIVVLMVALLGGVAWFLVQTPATQSQTLQSQTLKSQTLKSSAGWWIGTTIVVLVMMTDVGSGLYGFFFLDKIQFSWRWLSLTAITLPLLGGYLYSVLSQAIHDRFSHLNRSNPRLTRLYQGLNQGLLFLGSSALALTLFVQSNQVMDQANFDPTIVEQFNQLSAQKNLSSEPSKLPKASFLHWHWLFADGLGLGDVYEYRSKDITIALPPDRPYPLLQWATAQSRQPTNLVPSQVALKQWQPGKRSFEVTNLSDKVQGIQLRTLYYPGWQFKLDQQPWRSVQLGTMEGTQGNETGLVEIPIPPGTHDVRVVYRGTWAEQRGNLVTWLTLGITIGLVFWITLCCNGCNDTKISYWRTP